MQKLFENLDSLSDEKKFEILKKDFSSKELQEILHYLFELDAKIDSNMDLFDCCGTGGDQTNTFNISTTTAILASATGIKVCKNGGRSSSSKTGSVDVLEELGVNFTQSLEKKLLGLDKFNLAFHSSKASAQRLAPLKNLARKNKLSSFLSLIGPFTNPFFLKAQIIGVGKKEWLNKMQDLAEFYIKNNYCQKIALVQSYISNTVLDELSSIAPAKIIVIDSKNNFCFEFNPEEYNFTKASLSDLQGAQDHHGNAEIVEKIINKIIYKDADKAKLETCLINIALMKSLEQELSQESLKRNFNEAKSLFESGTCLENWQKFLDFQKN